MTLNVPDESHSRNPSVVRPKLYFYIFVMIFVYLILTIPSMIVNLSLKISDDALNRHRIKIFQFRNYIVPKNNLVNQQIIKIFACY